MEKTANDISPTVLIKATLDKTAVKRASLFKKFAFLLPLLSWVLLVITHIYIPSKQKPEAPGTFTAVLLCFIGIYAFLNILSIWISGLRKKVHRWAPFIAVVLIVVLIWDILTLKLSLLHELYFPNFDRIFYTFVTHGTIIFVNLSFSLRLFFSGIFFGTILGFSSGVASGWNQRAAYWLAPLQKIVGSLPAVALLPIVLAATPTSFIASTVLSTIAVFFPVSIMTATGVANVKKSYFDVARTLGGNRRYLIFRVAIPAAMPSVFIGMFQAFCTAFLVLTVAEMAGVKGGIGYFIFIQLGWGAYDVVFASIMLIALMFSGLITLLFFVKDRMLVWQRGLIKW
jgi:NitT/TauT family transport system permease protein